MRELLCKQEFVSYDVFGHQETSNFPLPNLYEKSYNPSPFDKDLHGFSQPTEKHPLFICKKQYNTEEMFVTHFANPMFSVTRRNTTVVVEREGDKVALKYFHSFKTRGVGKTWFKTVKNMEFITVNVKTGDVYTGHLLKYNLKRSSVKKIRRNFFATEPLNILYHTIRNNFKSHNHKFQEFDIGTMVNQIMYTFIDTIDPNGDVDGLTPSQRLFKFYLNKRGVKFPNNFYLFSSIWYGTNLRKELKKNGNRMVDTIMSLYNLSGKKIKKALHNCEGLNIEMVSHARKMFGDDWVNQDNDLILGCLNSNIQYFPFHNSFLEFVSTEELKRVFKLFKQSIVYNTLDSYSFYDHIRFYCELKIYEPNIKWMASDDNRDGFRYEHLDWTDKLQKYKVGTYYRTYPEYSYEFISKPITINDVTYYPVLLDNSSNYNAESATQSNCVKTYIGKATSIIVSLRKDDDKSIERATIEYKLHKPEDTNKVTIKRVQSLGRFNNKLGEEWNDVLFKLDERMLYYINDEKFDTVKIKKVCQSGLEYNATSDWNHNGYLVWDKGEIDNSW